MATTLNHDPHGKDGKVDMQLAEAAVHFMVGQFKSGKEDLIGVYRVDLADGSHQTIIHHKAS